MDLVISDEALTEAKQQAVSTLISDQDYAVLSTNIRVDAAHAELTEVLLNIPFVTIKGYASASYYPEPIKRPMGDVDFYVDPQSYDKAKETLIAAGYIPLNHEHVRHETFRKGKVFYELHSEIKGIPNGLDGIRTESVEAEERVRRYLGDVIKTSISVNTQYGEILIPDEFHHGLIMLLHIAGHIINDGGVGLRHICDWAVYADKADIGRYKKKLENIGLWTFACQLTAMCEQWLGLEKKYWVGEWEDGFINNWMEDILNGGNFGHKDNYRGITTKITADDYLIKGFVHLTKERFPITKQYPILLPAAIIWWAGRYLVKALLGKRKVIHKIDISKGKARNELYKQFRLFEK